MSQTNTHTKFSSSDIAEKLNELNHIGGFSIAVLTDMQGFPIASATPEDKDPDRQAAVVAKVHKTIQQVGAHLGMGETDEISLFDQDGQRLVSRTFQVKNHELILAVQIPERKKRYRGLMNRIIKQIQAHWML